MRTVCTTAQPIPKCISFFLTFLPPYQGVAARELELEAKVVRMMSRARTKPVDPSLITPSAPGEGEDKTYLLFTTGSLTYSPHQIGRPASPTLLTR